MKKTILAIITVLATIGAIIVYTQYMVEPGLYSGKHAWELPNSLDPYYPNSPYQNKPPSAYLGQMFTIVTSMEGIIVNTLQGDNINATNSFDAFAFQYKATSDLIPEWKRYFDINAVNRLGKAVKSGDQKEIFANLEKVGKACDNCHIQVKPLVWAKYYWPNFDNIKINTTNPNDSPLPWKEAKQKYIATSFDGITVSLQKGDTAGALKSYDQFRAMFINLKDGCNGCHNTPRTYYVSDDILSLVDSIPENINDPPTLGSIMGQIGDGCMKCHIIHQPAQFAKELRNLRKN